MLSRMAPIGSRIIADKLTLEGIFSHWGFVILPHKHFKGSNVNDIPLKYLKLI